LRETARPPVCSRSSALAVAACFRGREFPLRFARTPQRDPGSASFPSQAPHAAAACLVARRTGSRSSRRSPRRSPLRSTVEATNRRTHESAQCRQARHPGRRDRTDRQQAESHLGPRTVCAQARTRSSPAPRAEPPGCHLRFLCCPQSTIRDLCSFSYPHLSHASFLKYRARKRRWNKWLRWFSSVPITSRGNSKRQQVYRRSTQSVTAPSEADLTWLAYFASTPLV